MSRKIPLFLGVWVAVGVGSCLGQVSATVKDGCSSDIVLTRATKDLRDAEAALGAGNKVEAGALFDSALAVLGDRYTSNEVVDDSSMKLTLANIKQASGELDVSLHIKKSVTKSRLKMYRRKFDCEG